MTPERLEELRGYATENLAYIEAEATRLLPWQHRLAEAVAEIKRLKEREGWALSLICNGGPEYLGYNGVRRVQWCVGRDHYIAAA